MSKRIEFGEFKLRPGTASRVPAFTREDYPSIHSTETMRPTKAGQTDIVRGAEKIVRDKYPNEVIGTDRALQIKEKDKRQRHKRKHRVKRAAQIATLGAIAASLQANLLLAVDHGKNTSIPRSAAVAPANPGLTVDETSIQKLIRNPNAPFQKNAQVIVDNVPIRAFSSMPGYYKPITLHDGDGQSTTIEAGKGIIQENLSQQRPNSIGFVANNNEIALIDFARYSPARSKKKVKLVGRIFQTPQGTDVLDITNVLSQKKKKDPYCSPVPKPNFHGTTSLSKVAENPSKFVNEGTIVVPAPERAITPTHSIELQRVTLEGSTEPIEGGTGKVTTHGKPLDVIQPGATLYGGQIENTEESTCGKTKIFFLTGGEKRVANTGNFVFVLKNIAGRNSIG